MCRQNEAWKIYSWLLYIVLKLFLIFEILTPDYCRLNLKKKFVELDMKPICIKCFDKFPGELKKRIKKNNAKKYWTSLPLIFKYTYPSVLYFLHIPLFAFIRKKFFYTKRVLDFFRIVYFSYTGNRLDFVTPAGQESVCAKTKVCERSITSCRTM